MSETAKQAHLPRASTFDLGTQRLARIYAAALFQAALERNEVIPLQEELEAFFLEVMPADPSVGLFFASGGLGRTQRTEVLQKVWLPRVSETLGNLLMVLNEHERLNLFSSVGAAFFALCESSAGRITVQVRTPSALTAPERDSLLRQLRQTLK